MPLQIGSTIIGAVTADPLLTDTLVSCRGGPHGVGWLRVATPPPLEVDRGGEGIYVLDEVDGQGVGSPEYVWVPYRL